MQFPATQEAEIGGDSFKETLSQKQAVCGDSYP
jgi:hypothetical protein